MQSKTSCFNKTLFRKHVTRFWPVWAAYLLIWLLDMPVGMLSQREYLYNFPVGVQSGALNSVQSGTVLSFIFAVLMAMAVWSFLYNARSASGAACLPVTRTAQYWSAMLAGLLPLVAVHVVTFLLTVLAEVSIGLLHLPSLLAWLGASLLILIFFYGFATLCAMLTGNIIVLPAVYVVLNFVGVGAQVLLNGIAGCFVYGMNDFAADWMIWLSPIVQMLRGNLVESESSFDAARQAWVTTAWHFDGWAIVGIYAVVGVVMLLGALALLKKRQMETAGDVVAIPVLKPVFRWCMGIFGGLCFANMLLYLFDFTGETQTGMFVRAAVFLVIGAFLGWFIGEMLIRRSFKVFRGGWRGFGGWALCCAVLLLALTAVELDVFGYERRQPRAEQIDGVHLYIGGESAFLAEPEGIEQALALHRDIIAHKSMQDQCDMKVFFMHDPIWTDKLMDLQVVSCQINYYLKDGSAVSRLYELPYVAGDRSADAYAAQALLNSPEAVLGRKETPFDFSRDNVSYGSVSAVMPARECAAAAGYDDLELFVLVEYGGYTPAVAKALPDETKDAELRVILLNNRYLDYAVDPRSYDGKYYDYNETLAADLPEKDGEIDWDSIWLNYTMQLTKQEAWELYNECVLPDTAANALGRVWVLSDDDYAHTACAADLEIDARWPEDEGAAADLSGIGYGMETVPATVEDGFRYYSFTTTPTVDSARTNAWFEAHGLHLRTVAETRAGAR